jgi:phosphoribosyl-ATP pyrophosphohydrolase/phosphoribosyl-AMP cyclohydrolase
MKRIDLENYPDLDFDKGGGLIPAIVQDEDTKHVLMLGYMNRNSLQKTLQTGRVTFYSRSKKDLWTKGETSGNFLNVSEIMADCDEDTLLISVYPEGPVCHTGDATCFGNQKDTLISFVNELEEVIKDRKANPKEGSYTSKLFVKGLNKITQKFGEEAVEFIIESKDSNRELILNEAADVFFHMLILLHQKNVRFEDVLAVLRDRRK